MAAGPVYRRLLTTYCTARSRQRRARSRYSKGWTAITSARLEFSFEIDIHCAMITSAELIDRLASRDVVARTAAADELYGLGTAAVPPMIEALRCRWVGPSPQYALLCDTFRRLGRVAFAPVRDALSVRAPARGNATRLPASSRTSGSPRCPTSS